MNLIDRVVAFVIGDGNLGVSRNPPGNSNYRLNIKHSMNQKDYLLWKISILESLNIDGRCKRREQLYWKKDSIHNGKIYYSADYQSERRKMFTDLYKIAYINKVKTYHSGWVNEKTVDDLTLAIWWMDDGTLDYSKMRVSMGGKFCIDSSYEEVYLLKELFEKILNIEIRIHKHKKNFNLTIPYYDFPKFLLRIIKHVPPSMLYKCCVNLGEDKKPIIPNNAEQLIEQINKLKI